MRKLFRYLLQIQPTIDAHQAEMIARKESEKRGWTWLDPVIRRERIRSYQFWTNADKKGGNIIINVNIVNGRIIKAVFLSK